jgi:hypothetical protein
MSEQPGRWDRITEHEAIWGEHGGPLTPPSQLPNEVVRRLTGIEDPEAARAALEARQAHLRGMTGEGDDPPDNAERDET